MNNAMIKLKSNKDPTHPAIYLPLPLIKTDLKILSKTVESVIKGIILYLTHPNQTGFNPLLTRTDYII